MSLEDLFGPLPDEPDEPAKAERAKPPTNPKAPRQPKTPRQPKAPRQPKSPRSERAARAPRRPGGPGGSRTTLVLALVAGVIAAAVAITLGFALSRPPEPNDAPAASSTPSAPAPAAPVQTPEPSASTAAATIAITAAGFTLRDDDGAEFHHAWADAAEPAVAALTETFGVEPELSTESGDSHFYAYTVYSWDGFHFYDVLLGPGNRPRDQVDTPTRVSFTADEVDGVEVVAEFGLEIGQTIAEVQALGPDTGPTGTPPAFWFGTDRSTFYSDGVRSFGALAITDGERVVEIDYRYLPVGL